MQRGAHFINFVIKLRVFFGEQSLPVEKVGKRLRWHVRLAIIETIMQVNKNKTTHRVKNYTLHVVVIVLETADLFS
jgi:hypothetical protein